MEGNLFMKTKRLIPLSVQQMLDCSGGIFNDWADAFLDLVTQCLVRPEPVCGLESAETYPYTGTWKPTIANCKYDGKRMVAPLNDFELSMGQNFAWGEALTAKLLQEGPLATGFNARGRSFQFYSKGTHLTKALLT